MDSIATTSGSRLRWKLKFSYGVGHVLNDLCASMWFSYLLMYFHFVLQFSNSLAGVILLVGQVADALATPFVGIESDRVDDFVLCRYGRRKTWHLVGSVCVLLSFPFLFTNCLGCQHSSAWAQIIYYSAFVIIFQFGWASVQISHLSLIPDLTEDPHERTELNAIRYAFTVMANICVYGVTWAVLGISGDASAPKTHERIGPEDVTKFQNIVFILISIGAIHSGLFHLGVSEKRRVGPIDDLSIQHEAGYNRLATQPRQLMRWRNWLREPQFYQIMMLYMFTRLFVNLTQVYIPLYLQDTLRLREESIAIIPLIMFVSGFLSSFVMKYLNRRAGRKVTYILGVLIGQAACLWIYFGHGHVYKHYELYVVAVLLGASCSTVLITSLTITSDLIGNNVESGAFVYGAMSFADKLSNGIAIMLLQNLHPCKDCCTECSYYYRDILMWVSGGAITFAFVVMLTLLPKDIGARNSSRNLMLTVDDSTNPILENDNNSHNQ